jgi:Fe-S-cluster containining protein
MTDTARTMPRADERRQWRAWFDAASRAEVDQALRSRYDELDREIAGRNPTCWLSGKCCHFDTYGHRLYATGLEVAWLVRQLEAVGRDRLDAAELPGLDGCPFQVDRLCTVHAARPLGCRVYFCDPTAQHWQGETTERHLGELRRLHDRHALPYRYMEWRHGLNEARQVPCPASE